MRAGTVLFFMLLCRTVSICQTGPCKTQSIVFCGEFLDSCSCGVRCQVHRNCCEDFLTDRPEVAREGHEKFAKMFSASVVCEEDEIMVVTGCPSDTSASSEHFGDVWNATVEQVGTSQNITDAEERVVSNTREGLEKSLGKHQIPPHYADLDPVSKTCWDETVQQERYMSERLNQFVPGTPGIRMAYDVTSRRLMKMLEERRVTDRTNGFVYRNVDVFRCNARQESVPCLWRVYGSVDDDEDLKSRPKTSDMEFTVLPPGSDVIAKALQPSKCYIETIDSCTRNSMNFSEELQAKCQKFSSLVQTKSSLKVYRNRYCVECIEGPDQQFSNYYVDDRVRVDPEPTPNRHNFAVLVSLANPNAFSLRMMDDQKVTWSSAECDLGYDIGCEVTECNQGRVKRPDGKCKEPVFLHLAVRLKGRESLCTPEHRELSSFLTCHLGAFTSLDYAESSSAQLTVYRLPDDSNIFGAVINLYISDFDVQKFETLRVAFARIGASLDSLLNAQQECKKSSPPPLNKSPESSISKRGFRLTTVARNNSDETEQPWRFTSIDSNDTVLSDPSYPETFLCFNVSPCKEKATLRCVNSENSKNKTDGIKGVRKLIVRELRGSSCFRRHVPFPVCEPSCGDGGGNSRDFRLILLCGIQYVVCTYFASLSGSSFFTAILQ